jgi:hypothetical protein
MQIKVNNVDAAQAALISPIKPRRAVETDSASFQQATAIERSLQAVPAVRPEAVAQAQELVRDVKYPPVEAINGIAALLALKLEVEAVQ